MKLFKMQSKVKVRGLSQDKHAMLSYVEMDVECFGKTQHFSQTPVKVRFNNNIRSRNMESDCKGDECKVSVRAYIYCMLHVWLSDNP